MEIYYYQRMKYIQRMQRWPLIQSYNLLEHSYMVLVLVLRFAKLENIYFNDKAIDLIIHHDIFETLTGDTPYDVKNLNEVTKHSWDMIEAEVGNKHRQLKPYSDEAIKEHLTEHQYELFKCCDLLELWLFLKSEIRLGNQNRPIKAIAMKCEKLVLGTFKSIDTFIESYTDEHETNVF